MTASPKTIRAAVSPPPSPGERQLTRGAGGRILTNTGVWSRDGKWIVYDVRSDAAGEIFDGSRIEMVNVETGEIRILYQAQRGAHCGVATFNPVSNQVVFILGPENPTPDWQYGPNHRQGVMVEVNRPGVTKLLDARDLVPPFTPGALRGGSHVHVWDAHGEWVSFTYNDALVEPETRDVAITIPGRPVRVSGGHPRNHEGEGFSAVVTRTTSNPKPGSDEIRRACEEGWVGTNGYLRANGVRQQRALAFQGHVLTESGKTIPEVFIVDLPDDLTKEGEGPISGTTSQRPSPPAGVTQRRLTFTSGCKHPGLQGPRHWLRTSLDGSRIAFLMKDDGGIVQLWTVSPNGGAPVQVTRNALPIASAFTWSSDGKHVAHVMDNSVAVTEVASGATTRLTPRVEDANAPRPEACVFSPDGRSIAYVRPFPEGNSLHNQIMVLQWQ